MKKQLLFIACACLSLGVSAKKHVEKADTGFVFTGERKPYHFHQEPEPKRYVLVLQHAVFFRIRTAPHGKRRT